MSNIKDVILEAYKNSAWCFNSTDVEKGYSPICKQLLKTEEIISYRELKEKFLHTNVFKDEDLVFNQYYFLDDIIPYVYKNKIKFFDISAFLHGNCDIFAYLLAKRLGCNVVTYNVLDENGDTSDLLHAFCEAERYESYVDIRGLSFSDDISCILQYYDEIYWDSYMDDNYEIRFMDTEDAKDFFINVCKLDASRYDENNELTKEIDEFIELFIEKYDINFHKNQKEA